jgi:hypothetical protein
MVQVEEGEFFVSVLCSPSSALVSAIWLPAQNAPNNAAQIVPIKNIGTQKTCLERLYRIRAWQYKKSSLNPARMTVQ